MAHFYDPISNPRPVDKSNHRTDAELLKIQAKYLSGMITDLDGRRAQIKAAENLLRLVKKQRTEFTKLLGEYIESKKLDKGWIK